MVWQGQSLLLGLLDLLQQRRVELVEVLWDEVGVHLDVGELVCVALEVDLEVALGGEAVAADVALVGTLACVAPDMDLEGRV